MKRILITGANSYIGVSFEKYIISNYSDEFLIDTIDMLDGNWREKSFVNYDCVFHVAGIAHSDHGRISKEREQLYYSVNTDMAIETAQKAKVDGVKQFIFMSSSIVYGASSHVGKNKVINRETPISPENSYGDSKVQAEKGLFLLSDDEFKIVVIRSPMVYGKGCKGNYPVLSKIACCMPYFPFIRNKRSLIYIENLCEFIRLVINYEKQGIFWPQNSEYSNTSELVQMIARAHGREIKLIKGCEWLMKIMSIRVEYVKKAFGSFCYDKEISQCGLNYQIYSLKESIDRTEEK